MIAVVIYYVLLVAVVDVAVIVLMFDVVDVHC
jgi:hypothetical protein